MDTNKRDEYEKNVNRKTKDLFTLTKDKNMKKQ